MPLSVEMESSNLVKDATTLRLVALTVNSLQMLNVPVRPISAVIIAGFLRQQHYMEEIKATVQTDNVLIQSVICIAILNFVVFQILVSKNVRMELTVLIHGIQI